MKRVRLANHSGQEAWAFIEKVGATYWLHWRGTTHSFEDEKKRRGRTQQGADDPKQILAPMPGKILKVMVKQGDLVNAGQTLVVMEAMKMEYSLKAKAQGLVKILKVKTDMQVKANDLLVEMEPANES